MPLSRHSYRSEICCHFTMATFILNFPTVELLSSYPFEIALQLLLSLNPCRVVALKT